MFEIIYTEETKYLINRLNRFSKYSGKVVIPEFKNIGAKRVPRKARIPMEIIP